MSCSPWCFTTDNYLVCPSCGASVVEGDDFDPDNIERAYECGSVWSAEREVFGKPLRIATTRTCRMGGVLQRLVRRVEKLEEDAAAEKC